MNVFEEVEKELINRGFKVEKIDCNRPWGGFFVINEEQGGQFIEQFYPEEDILSLTKGGRISPKVLLVMPNKRLSWQYHQRRSEVWKLIKGEAGLIRSMTDEQAALIPMKIGEKITLKQGERHRLVGLDDYGVIAEIWQHTDSKNPSDEEDIIRIQDDFDRK